MDSTGPMRYNDNVKSTNTFFVAILNSLLFPDILPQISPKTSVSYSFHLEKTH